MRKLRQRGSERVKLMEKPMCRLCETRHGNNEPHVFGNTAKDTGGRTEDSRPVRGRKPANHSRRKHEYGIQKASKGKTKAKSGNVDDAAVQAGEADGDGAAGKAPLTQAERNRRWRKKHREYYNEYMRRYRSKKK